MHLKRIDYSNLQVYFYEDKNKKDIKKLPAYLFAESFYDLIILIKGYFFFQKNPLLPEGTMHRTVHPALI